MVAAGGVCAGGVGVGVGAVAAAEGARERLVGGAAAAAEQAGALFVALGRYFGGAGWPR